MVHHARCRTDASRDTVCPFCGDGGEAFHAPGDQVPTGNAQVDEVRVQGEIGQILRLVRLNRGRQAHRVAAKLSLADCLVGVEQSGHEHQVGPDLLQGAVHAAHPAQPPARKSIDLHAFELGVLLQESLGPVKAFPLRQPDDHAKTIPRQSIVERLDDPLHAAVQVMTGRTNQQGPVHETTCVGIGAVRAEPTAYAPAAGCPRSAPDRGQPADGGIGVRPSGRTPGPPPG